MHFLQIKPNSDKYIDGILSETILKLVNSNNFNKYNDSISDMTELIENYVIELSNDNIMEYINTFFINLNKTDITSNNYNVLCLHKTENYYHLLLINNKINDNTYLHSLSDEEKKLKFNLIASSLSQYYNNNVAIFGDAFLIHMNCNSFDNLNKLENIDVNTIYNSYKYYNLFELMADIYHITLYVKELNRTMVYSRAIINNYILTHKPVLVLNDVIKITYNDLTLFIKITDHLYDSHSSIVSTTSDSYYLSNIVVKDIELINKLD